MDRLGAEMMDNVRGATFLFLVASLLNFLSRACCFSFFFFVVSFASPFLRCCWRGGLIVRRTSERSIILNRTFAVRPKHRSYFRPDLKPIRDAAFTRVARVDLSAGTFSTSFFSFFLFARDLPRAARCFVVSSSEPWSACYISRI